MNILQAAYRVCKYIRSLPIREEITRLIHNLHFASPTEGTQSRSYGELGYLGKQASIQFLGYLVVNQKRDVLEDLPYQTRIGSLSPGELSLLERIHRFILQIDKNCRDYLGAILPNAVDAIDPYLQHDYEFQHALDKSIDLNLEPISNLFAAFEKHPSLRIIREHLTHRNNIYQMPEERLSRVILTIMSRIDSYGLFNVPPDLQQLEITVKKNSQRYHVGKILTALVALKTSLSILNQLLYQACLYDKLAVLNQDNVFEIGKHSRDFLGESISVSSQLLNHEIFSNAGGIVLIKLRLNNHKIDGLYRIESNDVSLSADFGSSMKLGLRRIDNNLNCYPGLTPDR